MNKPQASPEGHAAGALAAPASGAARPVKILVADDNAVNRKLTLLLLKKLGYAADVVNDGVEAVEAARTGGYGLILMDHQMPRLDGVDATLRIREEEKADPGRVRAYIIAVTANAMECDKTGASDAGMDDYLVKPIRAADLEAAIDRASAG